MHYLKRISIQVILFVAAFLAPAQMKQWNKNDGELFKGALITCTTEDAIFTAPNRKKFIIPLDELSENDRHNIVLKIYKNKYINALRMLRSMSSKSSNDIFIDSEHIPYLNDIGFYLKEFSKPIAEKFKSGGKFDESDDFWKRVDSGMMYFSQTYINELCSGGEMIKINEFRRPKLKNVIKHIENINEFFQSLNKGDNFFLKRLGKQFPIKFTPNNYVNDFQPYHYWVYLPKNYDAKTPMPLVVFLCGIGEFGTNLDAILTNELPKLLENRQDYPFIVVSPQDNDKIARPKYYDEVLNDAKHRFCVDEERVFATGISSGGAGVWRWGLESPHKFAALIPVCGVMPFKDITQLKNMPIWLYNNEKDRVWIQELGISQISNVNPNFKYTIFQDEEGHSAWVKAYKDPRLEEWMAAQKRNISQSDKDNPIDKITFEKSLSKPVEKIIPMSNYLVMEYDSTQSKDKYSKIKAEHENRYGSAHDSLLFTFSDKIYNFQHFELNQNCSMPMTKFVNTKNPEILIFGIEIKGFQKVDIRPPFEIRQMPSFKCFSAYYCGKEADPQFAINTLRRLAKKSGYSLNGLERIVYIQPMFGDRNFYELQVGVK